MIPDHTAAGDPAAASVTDSDGEPRAGDNLIFLIASPRSGSTLLQRMLGSHSQIHTHPEPHLITPLYYLGYYDTVQQAPYDHVNAAAAFRELCDELPHGEEDYLDALRAYADTLYSRVLAPTGKRFFLDKTPAYALVLPFLARLFPNAKYVVLTRHPCAIMHSVAHSFFAGDYEAAHAANPIVERYVPAIGRFLVERPVPLVHVRYDDLVADPKASMRRLLDFLGLDFEPDCVEYGRQKHISKSYGDPMSVEKHAWPVADSLERWAGDLLANRAAMQIATRSTATLDPEDLLAWGYPKERLFDALHGKQAQPTRAPQLHSYRLKRQALLTLRQWARNRRFATGLRKLRYFCDVLLRH